MASLPVARYAFASVMYANDIYVFSGDTGQEIINLVERYESESDTWIALSPKPLAVADISAVVIAGKIYIPGGRLASGAPSATTYWRMLM